MEKRKRILSMDLIRLISCLCVITVHFNASVSGFQNGVFVHPNSVVPNFLFGNRIYLGDIGTCLFFMLSGASLMLSYQPGDLKRYARKRWLAIFPMFYLAYFLATVLDFFLQKGLGSGSWKLLIFSLLGMDGYLANLGLIGYDFYKCGEWFLGCLLLLYLIFPVLHFCLEKKPAVTVLAWVAVYAAYGLWVRLSGHMFRSTLFFLRIPEMLFGMLFVKYSLREKPKLLLSIAAAGAIAALLTRNLVQPLTLCVEICLCLFALLTLLGERIFSVPAEKILIGLSGLTYPVFLVHHWLISKLSVGFNDAPMAKRNVLALYGAFLLLSFLAGAALRDTSRKLNRWGQELFSPAAEKA